MELIEPGRGGEPRIGEHEGEHGFRDGHSTRKDTRIVPASGGEFGGDAIGGNGGLGVLNRGGGLEAETHHDGHAVRDAPLNAPASVGGGGDAARRGGDEGVVVRGAGCVSPRNAAADFHELDGGQAPERCGDSGLEFVKHGRPPTRRHPLRHHDQRAPERITGPRHLRDARVHALSRWPVRTTHRVHIHFRPRHKGRFRVPSDVAHALHIGGDGDACAGQNLVRHRPRDHPRSRLPRTRPTAPPRIPPPKPHIVRKIRMTRPIRRLHRLVILRPRILIPEQKRNRRPRRHPLVKPAQELHPIRFLPLRRQLRLPRTPPIQGRLHRRHIQRQPRRAPVDDPTDRHTVGLPERRDPKKVPKGIACHVPKVTPLASFVPMRILFTHIKGLVGAYEQAPAYLAGADMNEFSVLDDAWLAVEDGRIADFGRMADFEGIADWSGLQVVNCEGRFVLPSWVDSHTHLVYAADRASEFLDRLNGLSYQTIAQRGGGILNSAERLQSMSEDALYAAARERLERALNDGIGALEIKTGYGLTVQAELKMLRVIGRLKREAPIPIKATLLGLHAVPSGMTAAEWTALAIEELLPQAAGSVDYIDAFCEQGYFGLEETEAWLAAGAAAGIPAKVHVNQFNAFGGVELCAKWSARSVDHLEELNEADIPALQSTLNRPEGPMFPVALPGCSHFLSIPYTPGRELIDAGLPLVLATDHNPGSAPSGSMRLAVQLAIVKMRLRPLEAIAAATLNAAAAMDVSGEVGAIAPGYRANLLLTRPMDDLIEIGYRFGEDPVERVFMNGVELPH